MEHARTRDGIDPATIDGRDGDITWSPLHRLIDVSNAVVDWRRTGSDPDDSDDSDRQDQLRAAVGSVMDQHSMRAREWPVEALDAIAASATQLLEVLGERDPDMVAVQLNQLLAGTSRSPRLSNHGGRPWHLHVDPLEFDWNVWFTSASALSLALALSERGRVVWGTCRADTCGSVFVDSGRGGPRLYCSNTCASRTRVAEMRARQRFELSR